MKKHKAFLEEFKIGDKYNIPGAECSVTKVDKKSREVTITAIMPFVSSEFMTIDILKTLVPENIEYKNRESVMLKEQIKKKEQPMNDDYSCTQHGDIYQFEVSGPYHCAACVLEERDAMRQCLEGICVEASRPITGGLTWAASRRKVCDLARAALAEKE